MKGLKYASHVSSLVFATLVTAAVLAADHRDGSIQQDQPADIADTYAFVNPNDTSKVVLGVTVNPYTVPGVNASFSTDILHQIKIDNDGDFVEDLVIQALYEGFDPNQNVTILGPAKPVNTGSDNFILRRGGNLGLNFPIYTGPSDGQVRNADDVIPGMRVFSGRADDPFFIDLIFVRSLLGVVPPLDREPGIDLFAGLNVSAIMIELPIDAVLSSSGDPIIRVWSTTSRTRITGRSSRRSNTDIGPWVQIDREGLPVVNAALIPAARRDEFNRGSPVDDLAFAADVQVVLMNLGFQDITGVLLPDVLTLDTTSTEPFLNGRAPADDFIDVVLGALSGGVVTSDGLDVNDQPIPPNGDTTVPTRNGFPDVFPFLGAEHLPSEAIPPRN